MVEVGELSCLNEDLVEEYNNIKPHLVDVVGLKFL